MGILREPDGDDFVIKSRPLTEKQAKALSEHIAKMKIDSKKQSAEKKIASK